MQNLVAFLVEERLESCFIVAPIVCEVFMFCLCFVMQYSVSFLVLQSSCGGRARELVALL